MKSLIVLIFCLSTLNLFATTAPFQEFEEERFSAIESDVSALETNVEGLADEKAVVVSVDISATISGTSTGIVIPASSWITHSSVSMSATTAQTSVTLSCESDADILADTDFSVFSVGETATGAITMDETFSWVYSDGCTVTASASGNAGNGTLQAFVKYFTAE